MKLEKRTEYCLIFAEDEMKKFRKEIGEIIGEEFDDVYECIKDVRL